MKRNKRKIMRNEDRNENKLAKWTGQEMMRDLIRAKAVEDAGLIEKSWPEVGAYDLHVRWASFRHAQHRIGSQDVRAAEMLSGRSGKRGPGTLPPGDGSSIGDSWRSSVSRQVSCQN